MMHSEMETQIHYLEQVAYSSVLRAFKAQSDALTWEKEGLITELRKELRVSDDEHRELLAKVNADDIICRIREWRNSGGNSSIMLSIPQSVHDPILSSPTGSMTRKRQKTSTPLSVHSQAPSVFGSLVKTPRPSPRFPPVARTPRGILSNHGSSAFPLTNNPDAGVRDPLIGRKVFTRWPDDNNFYAATIYDYNPNQGRHCLAYDKETYEWVNLKEIPPEDIRWADEDPVLSHPSGRGRPGGGPGRGIRNPNSHDLVPVVERGRADQFDKGFPPLQNGIATNDADEIEILHTDTLIKEVEKVFDTSHPDLAEIEKAKKMLKDHERALVDVIAKLADASDSESDGEQPFMQGHTTNNNQGTRRLQYSASGGRRPDGSTMARIRLTPNDNQHEEHIDIV